MDFKRFSFFFFFRPFGASWSETCFCYVRFCPLLLLFRASLIFVLAAFFFFSLFVAFGRAPFARFARAVCALRARFARFWAILEPFWARMFEFSSATW